MDHIYELLKLGGEGWSCLIIPAEAPPTLRITWAT